MDGRSSLSGPGVQCRLFRPRRSMPIERDPPTLSLLAPAKVNLYLEVLGKRPDGYHDLETVLVAVDLYDRLEFRPDDSGALTLTCDEPGLTSGPDNLVIKAAERLRRNVNYR